MRRAISSAIVFLVVLFFINHVQAQSGRMRPQTNPGTGSKTQTTNPNTGEASTDDSSGVNQVDGPEETVEGDVIRVNTSLVTVPVSVMDRYGKAIPNMRRQDFHIFDQGVEQKIAYFGTVDTPFTVALVIDTSGSTHFKLEEIQDAAISFVNQLQPQDRVMVISFDDRIRVLAEPTSDRGQLTHAIRRTGTGGGTRLYDTVDMVIRKKMSGISGRKAIVLFTDGVDTTSRSASFSSTLREAQESDAGIYTVSYDTSHDIPAGAGGLPYPGGRGGLILGIPGWPGAKGGLPGAIGSPEEYRIAIRYLQSLSDVSGGRYFRGDTLSDVASAFGEVADELRRQYTLGYYPHPTGQAGQLRQIKVRVNQPDLVVRARDSYIYASPNSSAPNSKTADAKP